MESFDKDTIFDSTWGWTWITFDEDNSEYNIQVLKLMSGSHVALQPIEDITKPRKFTTRSIQGDGFIKDPKMQGTLHVGAHQEFKIVNADLYVPTNLRLYKDGHLSLQPNQIKFINANLYINGTLNVLGSCEMVRSNLYFGASSNSDRNFVAGKYTYSGVSLSVSVGSKVYMTEEVDYQATFETLNIKTSSQFVGRKVSLEVQTLLIEPGGKMNFDSTGHRKSGLGKCTHYTYTSLELSLTKLHR